MANNASWFGVAGLLIAVPVIVVAVLGGGASGGATASPGSTVIRPGSVPQMYLTLIETAGSRCAAAPAPIIAAQLKQESNFNPKAVSSAGAEGIAQFLPGTWKTWGAPGTSPFDPAAAIPAEARYDCAIAEQVQTWQEQGKLTKLVDVTSLMLAGYNAGPDAVLATNGIPQNGQTPGYVQNIVAMAAQFASPVATAPGSLATNLIAAARKEIGQLYMWGGGSYSGPTMGGFDCSGLVMYAMYVASGGKIKLDHLAQSQVFSDAARYHAQVVPRGQQQPGDLIGFWEPGDGWHHVGIYVGTNQLLNAPETGALVRLDSLDTGYYRAQGWRVVRYS